MTDQLVLFQSGRSWLFKALTSFCAIDATITVVALPKMAEIASTLAFEEQLILGTCYSFFCAVPLGLLGVIHHYQVRYPPL